MKNAGEAVKTRVISLPHCVDRRERTRQQLDGIGIEFTFFDAVDGAQADFPLADKRNDALTMKRLGNTLSNAELACYASHYLLWQECVTENRALLILEDDMQLQGNFRQVYDELPRLAEHYAFLKLCGTFARRHRRVARVAPNLNVVRHSGLLCGSGCYLLTPSAARRFLRHSASFAYPVDNFKEMHWRHGVPCYSLLPWPAAQADMPSVIGDDRQRGEPPPLSGYGKARRKLSGCYEHLRRRLFFYLGW